MNKHYTRGGRHHLGLFPENKNCFLENLYSQIQLFCLDSEPIQGHPPPISPLPVFFPSPWHLRDLAVVGTYLPPRPAQVEGRGKKALFLTLCTLLVHEISLLSPLIHLVNPFPCLKRIVTAQPDVLCSNRRKKLVHLCENKANRIPKQKGYK